MITSGVMKILHSAIQIYDKLCGQHYLIVFGSKNQNNYQCVEIAMKESYFWHLAGCGLEPDSIGGKHDTYQRCKNREDVSGKITTLHGYSEIQEKYDALRNVFNFVEKASQTKVCYALNCPEQYIFKIGAGSESGVIGYDYPNHGKSEFLFPKSAQKKALSKISQTTHRIFLILSKPFDEKYYNKVEYEIKAGIMEDIKQYIPDTINISIAEKC